MRRILLAVGAAATTLETARQIRPWLRERDTSLTLLTVIGPSELSPLSHAKKVLEQVEAVFTDAAEKPGIVLRLGGDPAAEICREARLGRYDLVAIGLRDQQPYTQAAIGSTCQQVIETCTVPLFISPPNTQPGLTPQILIVADDTLRPSMLDWVLAQCRAQNLNVILYTSPHHDGEALARQIGQTRVRSQIVTHSGLSAGNIARVSQDRRVRWIVASAGLRTTGAHPGSMLETLLGEIDCPLLIVPPHDPFAR